MNNQYLLGIDGGGSKCRAVIATMDGETIGCGVGGPANPLHGFQKTIDSILDAVIKALDNASLPHSAMGQLVAGIGLAGVNLPQLYKQVDQWRHPFAQMYLTTDLDIANIGAHNGAHGAVIIVGTGSCGFSSAGGKKTILGGHGFPIGDKGSGAWMGLEAIKHTLLVLDGFACASMLSAKICQAMSVDDALALSEIVAGRSSRQFATFASIVFEAADHDDFVASNIVKDAIAYIEKMANVLLRSQPERLCIMGGLAKYFLPRLPLQLSELFVDPIQQPEMGALVFAQQCWKKQFHKDATATI